MAWYEPSGPKVAQSFEGPKEWARTARDAYDALPGSTQVLLAVAVGLFILYLLFKLFAPRMGERLPLGLPSKESMHYPSSKKLPRLKKKWL